MIIYLILFKSKKMANFNMFYFNIRAKKVKIAFLITIISVITCVAFTVFEIRTKTQRSLISDENYGPIQAEKTIKSSDTVTGPVAIFRNVFPWSINETENILISYGINYTLYNSLDMGIVDLSPFEKVIIESDQNQLFYDTLALNKIWLENYVTNGGVLEIHAADGGSNGGLWDELYLMPGGINHTNILTDNVTINLPLHPILSYPNNISDNELDYWGLSAHGYFNTYPGTSKAILLDGNSLNPVFIELNYGKGTILITMQPLEWAYDRGDSNFLENVILYIPEVVSTEPRIPGYSLYILIGIVCVISVILIKKSELN